MDTDAEPGEPDRRPSTTRRRAAPACLGGVAAALLLGASVVGLATHASQQQADRRLLIVRHELRDTTRHLAVVRTTLGATNEASTAAGATLAAETARLSALDSTLARAQADVWSQGVSIADLDACLSGVEQALNQISLSDAAGAGRTLSQVGPTCARAEPPSP